MKRTYIFHPFLFTIYAILAPLSANMDAVGLQVIKTLVLSLVGVVVLSIVARLALKRQEKAALLVSGLVILFFSYGHVEALLSKRISWAGMDVLLLAIYVLIFGGWVTWVFKKLNAVSTATNYLNLVSLILVIFPLYAIFTYTRQSEQSNQLATEYQGQVWQQSGLADLKAGTPAQQPLPDIYYIILDGYTRADVLQELFAYDNSAFIQALAERGFYVAGSSRSNYADTVYSISSSLNMAHINTLPDFLRPKMEVSDQKVLQDTLAVLVDQNRVRSFLAEQGYAFVQFDNSYPRISIESADYIEKSPEIGQFNPQAAFDLMVLNTTVGKAYFRLRGEQDGPLQSLFDEHRTRIRFTLDNLASYADREGQYFIYAHIIAPHAPYVFGPNGEARRGVDPFTLLDDPASEGWSPDLYRDQVIFINKMILVAIDQVLARSDPQPVIILQADHSNRAYNAVEPSDDLRMKLLFPILNAYYLPGHEKNSPVYPTITPVNSFRLVFNTYFGTRLGLLEDTSYVIARDQGRLEFIDACQAYHACSP